MQLTSCLHSSLDKLSCWTDPQDILEPYDWWENHDLNISDPVEDLILEISGHSIGIMNHPVDVVVHSGSLPKTISDKYYWILAAGQALTGKLKLTNRTLWCTGYNIHQ